MNNRTPEDENRPGSASGPSASSPRSANVRRFEDRLAEARATREKLLSHSITSGQAAPSGDRPPAKKRPVTRDSWTRRMEEARAARNKVLAERKGQKKKAKKKAPVKPPVAEETISVPLPPAEPAPAPPAPEPKPKLAAPDPLSLILTEETETAPRRSILPALALCAALLFGSLFYVLRIYEPVQDIAKSVAPQVSSNLPVDISPTPAIDALVATIPGALPGPKVSGVSKLPTLDNRPDQPEIITRALPFDPGPLAGFPTDVRVVVVTHIGRDNVNDLLGTQPAEFRLTPFVVAESAVHYFDNRDAAAAERIANRVGAEAVDLSGIKPTPPLGTIAVYIGAD